MNVCTYNVTEYPKVLWKRFFFFLTSLQNTLEVKVKQAFLIATII